MHVDPIIQQSSFRGRNDTQTLNSTTFTYALDTDWDQLVDDVFRVRYLIQEINGGSKNNVAFKLQYNWSGSPGWNDVSGTSPLQWAASGQYADQDATSQVLGSGSFVANEGSELDNITETTTSFAANEETETEWALTVDSAQVTDADTIDIRMVESDGTLLGGTYVTPQITVDKPAVVTCKCTAIDVDLTYDEKKTKNTAVDLDLTYDLKKTKNTAVDVDLTYDEKKPRNTAIDVDITYDAKTAKNTAVDLDLTYDVKNLKNTAVDVDLDYDEKKTKNTAIDLDMDIEIPSAKCTAIDLDLDYDEKTAKNTAIDLDLDYDLKTLTNTAVDVDVDYDVKTLKNTAVDVDIDYEPKTLKNTAIDLEIVYTAAGATIKATAIDLDLVYDLKTLKATAIDLEIEHSLWLGPPAYPLGTGRDFVRLKKHPREDWAISIRTKTGRG
jgi:hypothetical protein